MSQKNLWVLLVGVFALAVLGAGSASAFGQITDVEISGVDVLGSSIELGNFAGDRVPVWVVFTSDPGFSGEVLAEDVRVKVWISGESQNLGTSERFDVLAGTAYPQLVYLGPTLAMESAVLRIQTVWTVILDRADAIVAGRNSQ